MTIRKKDGEVALDGKWAILFKAQLACLSLVLPMLIVWGTWVTINIAKLDPNQIRYTHADAKVLEVKVNQNTEELSIRRGEVERIKLLVQQVIDIRESSLRIENELKEQANQMERKIDYVQADYNRRIDKVEATDREFLKLLTELFNKVRAIQ